jgi:hypothetical protein
MKIEEELTSQPKQRNDNLVQRSEIQSPESSAVEQQLEVDITISLRSIP